MWVLLLSPFSGRSIMLRFFLTLLKDLNSKKILLRVCVTSIGTSQSVAGWMCTREAGSADPRAEPECVLMA